MKLTMEPNPCWIGRIILLVSPSYFQNFLGGLMDCFSWQQVTKRTRFGGADEEWDVMKIAEDQQDWYLCSMHSEFSWTLYEILGSKPDSLAGWCHHVFWFSHHKFAWEVSSMWSQKKTMGKDRLTELGGGWILLAVVWNLGNVFEHGV